MITPQELRIGNWVMYNNPYYTKGPQPERVESINKEGLLVDGDSGHEEYSYLYNELEPIPLTPEILEKAGFIPRGWGHWITHPKLPVYQCELREGILEMENQESDPISFADIKYLHQLQNLYFALTGEELIIEL